MHVLTGISPFFVPVGGRKGAPSVFAREPIDEHATYQMIRRHCRLECDPERAKLCGDDASLSDADDLAASLCTTSPQQRLGAENAEALRGHRFFAGLPWSDLPRQSSPLVEDWRALKPGVSSKNDVAECDWEDGTAFNFMSF